MEYSKHGNQITLILDDNENDTINWLTTNKGSEYIKNFLKEHIDQRSKQKDYDKLQEIHRTLLSLPPDEKAVIQEHLDTVLNTAKVSLDRVMLARLEKK